MRLLLCRHHKVLANEDSDEQMAVCAGRSHQYQRRVNITLWLLPKVSLFLLALGKLI